MRQEEVRSHEGSGSRCDRSETFHAGRTPRLVPLRPRHRQCNAEGYLAQPHDVNVLDHGQPDHRKRRHEEMKSAAPVVRFRSAECCPN